MNRIDGNGLLEAPRYAKFRRCDLRRAFLCSIPAENDKNANISTFFAVDSRFDGKWRWML